MKAQSFAPLVFVLGAQSLAGCEPYDEGPPPATARGADLPPATPDPEPGAAAVSAAGDTRYASAEIAVGEDHDTYDDNDPAALTDFRKTLDPYGQWVDDPKYGTVWEPSKTAVGDNFVPYSTAGHWVYDDEWVWASDYEWGWAPFHYGRWVYVEGSGWAWVPGREYRGAWVEWGVDPAYAYLGWYPMAPAFLWFGGVGLAYGFYVGPSWAYCPRSYVFAPNVGAHVIAGPTVGPVAARVTGYVGATPGVGPSPTKLGYTAATIPHSAPGVGGSGIAQAQSFARPSTATPLGAHAPTPVASTASASAAARSSLTSGGAAGSASARAGGAATTQTASNTKKGEPGDATPPKKAASGSHSYHPASAPGTGGFHGVGGGGGHGGGHH